MIYSRSFRPAASRGTRRAPVASAVFPCLQKFGAREVSPRLPAPVSLQPFLAHRHPPLLTHPPRPSQWQRLSRRRLTKRLPSLPPPRRLRPRPRRPLQRLLSPPRRSSLRRRRRCDCSPNFGFYSYAKCKIQVKAKAKKGKKAESSSESSESDSDSDSESEDEKPKAKANGAVRLVFYVL